MNFIYSSRTREVFLDSLAKMRRRRTHSSHDGPWNWQDSRLSIKFKGQSWFVSFCLSQSTLDRLFGQVPPQIVVEELKVELVDVGHLFDQCRGHFVEVVIHALTGTQPLRVWDAVHIGPVREVH